MQPTILDLFSGIGGFSLAFESVGFKTIGFAEIDSYASAVLKKHWPGVPNYGDVRTITAGLHISPTVITGGFPCQPFSVAGERRGDSDERFLWPECVRIMRELRPRFALFENVPGITTIDGGRTFNRVLSDISALGYDCLWNCVPACSVGAYHERERIWLVASDSKCQGLQRHGARETIISGDKPEQSIISNGVFAGRHNWRGHCGRISDRNGVSYTMARHSVKCYGNSIVPQVAQIFARAIYQELAK